MVGDELEDIVPARRIEVETAFGEPSGEVREVAAVCRQRRIGKPALHPAQIDEFLDDPGVGGAPGRRTGRRPSGPGRPTARIGLRVPVFPALTAPGPARRADAHRPLGKGADGSRRPAWTLRALN